MTRQRNVVRDEQHRQLRRPRSYRNGPTDRGLHAEFNMQGVIPARSSSLRCRELVLDDIEQSHRLIVVAAHRPIREVVDLTGFEGGDAIVRRFVSEVVDADARIVEADDEDRFRAEDFGENFEGGTERISVNPFGRPTDFPWDSSTPNSYLQMRRAAGLRHIHITCRPTASS